MDNSAFPDPPSSNVVGPSLAQPQPSIDAILAQSLIQDDSQYTSTPRKEVLPSPAIRPQETAPLIEISEKEPLPVEVEGYLQKLDEAGDIKLSEPITHDGEVLLADTEAQVVREKIVLPLSHTAHQQGMQAQVTDSKRWLAEWCNRLIKMFKDGVKYAEETSTN